MLLPFLLFVSLVNDVRGLIARHDLEAAERVVRSQQSQAGVTSEVAAALSWIARGALDAKQLDKAETCAAETRKMALDLMRTRKLDADPWLPTALGASIEVHAQVLAARGERSDAIGFLRRQLDLYGATSIGERIRKDLNLLNLVGKAAPPLDEKEWIGGAKPPTLAALRGRPVLLFFWAHWCGDCKAEAPILASVMNSYGPRGLALIAPTRLYGYVGGGLEAPSSRREAVYRASAPAVLPNAGRRAHPGECFQLYGLRSQHYSDTRSDRCRRHGRVLSPRSNDSAGAVGADKQSPGEITALQAVWRFASSTRATRKRS